MNKSTELRLTTRIRVALSGENHAELTHTFVFADREELGPKEGASLVAVMALRADAVDLEVRPVGDGKLDDHE